MRESIRSRRPGEQRRNTISWKDDVRVMAKKLSEPTREQYEQLISLLEKSNEIQEKTIHVLEQQVEVLRDMLSSTQKMLKEKEAGSRFVVYPE